MNWYDIFELSQFLNDLDEGKTYVLTFDFVLSWLNYDEDSPVINLSKPIIITKNSNPRLLCNFIQNKLRLACENYFLENSLLEIFDYPDRPGVLVKYSEISLF